MKPTPLPNPDWSAVIKMATEHTDDVAKNKGNPDDDKGYIYEGVMEAVFGPGYFKWSNAQTK